MEIRLILSSVIMIIVGVVGIIFHKTLAKYQYHLNALFNNNYFSEKILRLSGLVISIIFLIIGLVGLILVIENSR